MDPTATGVHRVEQNRSRTFERRTWTDYVDPVGARTQIATDSGMCSQCCNDEPDGCAEVSKGEWTPDECMRVSPRGPAQQPTVPSLASRKRRRVERRDDVRGHKK